MIRRNMEVDVDGSIYASPLKMTAIITKSADSDSPDFAEVQLYNLNEDSRSRLTTKGKRMMISAGHGDQIHAAFMGDIQVVTSRRENTEWITTIIAGDGATAMRQSVINKTYKSPVAVRDLIQDIATTSKIAKETEFIGIDTSKIDILRGVTLTAPARKELTRLCNPRGWTWNVQDDVLTIRDRNFSRENTAFLISVATGMVGSPEWINQGQTVTETGGETDLRIKVTTLALPGIRPNDKLQIQTSSLEGRIGTFTFSRNRSDDMNDFFTAERVTHRLDSTEGDFVTEIEATLQKDKDE